MVSSWYAVHVRSRHEFAVSKNLQAKGIEVFLPTVEKIRQWKDRRKRVSFPLFPGYLFVRISNAIQSYLQVVKTAGVVKILGNLDGFVPVPEEQIHYLHTLVQSRFPLEEHRFLTEGQEVRIVQGPLRGVQGVFIRRDGIEKLVVSVNLIQRGVAVRVNLKDVEVFYCHDEKCAMADGD